MKKGITTDQHDIENKIKKEHSKIKIKNTTSLSVTSSKHIYSMLTETELFMD